MNASVISALAALCGAAIGGLTSVLATWLAERAKARSQWLADEKTRRQELYREFVQEASKCYIDALQHGNPDLPTLIRLYAMIGRMRILSSPDVIRSAEQVARTILDTYLDRDRTFIELRDMARTGSIDLLREFGEACRSEFDALHSSVSLKLR
jgi:hypothetical protein